MSGLNRIDELAYRSAILLARNQPRCDSTIPELPSVASAISTDLIPLYRNGVTYGCPIGGLPGGGTASSDFFSVKANGAKGDGVTDDTAAIQATIGLAAVAGGIVFFPPGRYLVSQTLTVSSNGVSFLGCGTVASVILSSPAQVAPTVLAFGSGVSYCFIDSLGFTGNAVTPAPPPNAPSVITFNAGVKLGVYRCYFTSNLGSCVTFTGCTDGEVAFCRFNGTGYNGAGASTALQTPAVFSDFTSVGIRAHHNHFNNCQYFAIQHLGKNCEASYNYLTGTGACGIRIGNGSSTYATGARIIGNYIETCFKFSSGDGSGGGTGVYCNNANNVMLANNIISATAGDGVSFAGCNDCVIANNIAYNCCQTAGDCGFQFNPQSGNTGGNVGMVWIGNVSYDNQGSPTQQNGMRVLGPGSGGAFGAVILGNSFQGFTGTVGGQPQNSIAMTDSVLDDDSNVIRGNAGGQWQDFMHLGAQVTVPANTNASAVGTPSASVLYATTIQAGEMGLQRGFKAEFYGTTTGNGTTDEFNILLSYGATLGNVFQDTGSRVAVNNAKWLLEVWMFAGGSNSIQRITYRFSYNGALVSIGNQTINVTSGSDQAFTLQGQTNIGNAGATVICNAATVRRD